MPATDSEIIVNVLANITGLKTGLSQAEAAVKQASAQMQAMGEKGSASMQMISMSAEQLAALLQAVAISARKTTSEVTTMGEAHRAAARKVDELALAEKVLGKTATELVRATRGYVSALRGMSEMFGVAMVVGYANHLANTAIHMAHLARISGMSVSNLVMFTKAMEESGVSAEQVENILPRFAEHVWMAAQGASEQRKALESLGVSMDYLKKHGNDLTAVLMKISDNLYESHGSTEKLGQAYLILGRGSKAFAGALSQGSGPLKESMERYRDLAEQIEKSVPAAEKFRIEETMLWAQIQEAVLPVLRALPPAIEGVDVIFQAFRVDVQWVLLVLNSIGAAVIGLIKALIALGKWIAEKLGLISLFGKHWQDTSKVMDVVRAVADHVTKALEKAYNAMKKFGEGLIKTLHLEGAIDAVKKTFGEAVDVVKKPLSEAAKVVADSFKAAWSDVPKEAAKNIKNFHDAMQNAREEAAKKLIEDMEIINKAAKEAAKSDLDSMIEESERKWNKIISERERRARGERALGIIPRPDTLPLKMMAETYEKEVIEKFRKGGETIREALRPDMAIDLAVRRLITFGPGDTEEQIRMAEAMMEHVRTLYESGKISYKQMATEQVNILEEMHRLQLISDQEYARRSLRLQDELLRGQSKEMGDRFSEGFAQALVEGMTGREPHSLSIALYNWFAKSWNSAIEKFITSGISFLMNLLRSKLGAIPGEGGLFGGLLGVFTARKPVRTPPFFPTAAGTAFSSLVAPARAAGMQSAHAFGDAFSSQLVHLPITRSVRAMMSGVTSAVAASSRTALSQQKSIDRESKLSSAKTAAAHVFKSVAAIPIIGWIMAPGAAAAAFATVMAFQKGGIVPETGLALVHKNELVLPSHLANDIRNAVRAGTASGFPGGAGNVHFHYSATVNALDSRGVEDVLSQHGRTIVALLEKQIRSKNWA